MADQNKLCLPLRPINTQNFLLMKKMLLRTLLMIWCVFASHFALAQSDPQQVLQASLDELVAEFTDRRTEFETDKSKLYDFAERAIDNNWDFAKMAQLVLGKNWRRINDDQKLRFTEAFKGLMVRTYSTTMFKYTGKEALELDAPIYKGKNNKRAVVNASGNLGDGSEPIPLAFSMFLDHDGAWRIYNISAAGISLVTTYRSSYGQIIAAKGIDSLIESINEKTSD
jgi:phospholipid transport system substrate-binding protein